MLKLKILILAIVVFCVSCDQNNITSNKKSLIYLSILLDNEINQSKIWKSTSNKISIHLYGGMPFPDGTSYNANYTYNKNELSDKQISLLQKVRKINPDCNIICEDCPICEIYIYNESGTIDKYYNQNSVPCTYNSIINFPINDFLYL